MTKTVKREMLSRGKGFLSAAGPQFRFILFLIFVLVAYTFLLRIFQKLAIIVDLPVFLPIALVSLLAFIGISGTLYSHRFVGPMVRIRKTLEQVARGDCAVSLRLRGSDDPMMKDLVDTIGKLCENTRESHHQVQTAARELGAELASLREGIRAGASNEDLRRKLDAVELKQAALEKAVTTLGT